MKIMTQYGVLHELDLNKEEEITLITGGDTWLNLDIPS